MDKYPPSSHFGLPTLDGLVISRSDTRTWQQPFFDLLLLCSSLIWVFDQPVAQLVESCAPIKDHAISRASLCELVLRSTVRQPTMMSSNASTLLHQLQNAAQAKGKEKEQNSCSRTPSKPHLGFVSPVHLQPAALTNYCNSTMAQYGPTG